MNDTYIGPNSGLLPPVTETSLEAFYAIQPIAGKLRRRVYDAICAAGLHGLTDDEGECVLAMRHQTYTPRRFELMRAGRLKLTGETRRTRYGKLAHAWRACRPGETPDIVLKIQNRETRVVRNPYTTQANKIYQYIFNTGGATDDEGEHALNIIPQAYKASRLSLVDACMIRCSDEQRETRQGRNAWVWVVA